MTRTVPALCFIHVMRPRILGGALALALASCASNGGTDAYVCADWVAQSCPPPPAPAQPASFTPPTVACGDIDAGLDPCASWVDCVPSDVDAGYAYGAWAVRWTGGTCVGGSCVFTAAPGAQYCYAGCTYHPSGPYGRCTNPGSTAP